MTYIGFDHSWQTSSGGRGARRDVTGRCAQTEIYLRSDPSPSVWTRLLCQPFCHPVSQASEAAWSSWMLQG